MRGLKYFKERLQSIIKHPTMVDYILPFLKFLKDYIIKACVNFFRYIRHNPLKSLWRTVQVCILLFVSCIGMIVAEMLRFDFSEGLISNWRNNEGKKVIAIYSASGRAGEHLLYLRALKAAKSMNIEYVSCSFRNFSINSGPGMLFFTNTTASILNYIFKPAFNLSLTQYANILPYGINVLYVNIPNDGFVHSPLRFKEQFAHVPDYDMYADIRTLTTGDNKEMVEMLKLHDKKKKSPDSEKYLARKYKFVPLYLGCNDTPLKVSPVLKEKRVTKMALIGSLWGCYRNSFTTKRMLMDLAEKDLLEIYGDFSGMREIFGDRTHKFVDLDIGSGEIADIYRDYGVALIIHTLEHINENLPTSRISESVSGGVIVISDRHPFVLENFGDSVLYFDHTSGNREKLAAQIEERFKWAQEHPEEAIQKVEKAYSVWHEKFTFEKQLHNFIEQMDVILQEKID